MSEWRNQSKTEPRETQLPTRGFIEPIFQNLGNLNIIVFNIQL